MKTVKTFSLLLIVLAGFASCTSTRSVQSLLNNLSVDLDYELTSPVYEGEREKIVYLSPIDSSKMEHYTQVTSSRILFLPFIFYNYGHKKFNIVLGEHTLTQPYREFLTDALLAESNRSACFSLTTNDKPSITDYRLDVEIIRNKTLSGIQEINTFGFFPTTSFVYTFNTNSYRVLPTSSDLEIAVSLKKNSLVLWEKNYTSQVQFDRGAYGDFVDTNEKCVVKMTQGLALVTEQIVTAICKDLNLILSVP